MFMFYNLCIRKKETVLFLQYVYEGNRIIPTKCLCSIICVSERKKLYYSYSMFMSYFLYIRKGETAAYLGYAEGLKFVFHKEGKCIMPMICLQSSLCIMCLFWAYSNWMIRGTVLLFVLEKWRKLYLIWCIYIVYYVTDISNYRRGGGGYLAPTMQCRLSYSLTWY
jgi:hypothetical protein